MALQKEIWINSIIEGLFADNSFAARSINHSEFVNNKRVHVPNAGAGPAVVKNRTALPANVTVRTDNDVEYDLNEYTTDPIRISHADSVELSYNKRESVIRVSRAKLIDKVHDDLLSEWISGAGAITPGSTMKETIMLCKKQFDNDNVPQTGRYMLLTAETYNDLLGEMTDNERNYFLVSANAATGTLGKYMSFDYYMRSKMTGGSSDPDGFVWWENALSRALGETVMFDNPGDATYYSDIMSFLVRTGGAVLRYDGIGVLTF